MSLMTREDVAEVCYGPNWRRVMFMQKIRRVAAVVTILLATFGSGFVVGALAVGG